MKRGFGGLNTGNQKDARVEEIVRVVKLGKDFKQLRPVGDVFGYAQRWIDIQVPKGVISIPKVALNYDPETDDLDASIEDPYEGIPNPMRLGKRYFVNCIDRDAQDDEPRKKPKASRDERKSGMIDGLKSKTWTPMVVLGVPAGVARMLQNLMQMNKHKVKGKTTECELSDPKYGCDIFISYDEHAKPNSYNVQKGDHTPLTEDEQEYLLWKIDALMTPETLEQARKEAEALSSKNPIDENAEEESEDEDGDEDDALEKRRAKRKKEREKAGKGGKDKSEKSGKGDKSDKKKKPKDEDEDEDPAAARRARLKKKRRQGL